MKKMELQTQELLSYSVVFPDKNDNIEDLLISIPSNSAIEFISHKLAQKTYQYIGEHDFQFKSKNAKAFLESGNKVKFTVRFRGRELNNVKAGETVLNKFIEDLAEISTVEKKPFLEGKTMFIILTKKV